MLRIKIGKDSIYSNKDLRREGGEVRDWKSKERWLVISDWWMGKNGSGVWGLESGKNEIPYRTITG